MAEEELELERVREELAELDEQLKRQGDERAPEKIPVDTDVENNSVYVGSVEYSAQPHELQEHFASCGNVVRCTIICNKFTGQPMGYAYIEFDSSAAVQEALNLNDSLFKGRQIKVLPKRVNMPGMSARRPMQSPRRISRRPFRPYYGARYSPYPSRGFRPRAQWY
eukprot:TRINITY_DN1351_c0_g1_i1.p1 TRINITY_DN1351_c0_g1~~TRINITY_DN1351_c0_g1_i1.p1  ORF type:complete len:166 (-),score=16.48 TRINITY_DN1351_c0_g1_i1:30-527(-)